MSKCTQNGYNFSNLELMLLNIIGLIDLYESDRQGRPEPIQEIINEGVGLLNIYHYTLED